MQVTLNISYFKYMCDCVWMHTIVLLILDEKCEDISQQCIFPSEQHLLHQHWTSFVDGSSWDWDTLIWPLTKWIFNFFSHELPSLSIFIRTCRGQVAWIVLMASQEGQVKVISNINVFIFTLKKKISSLWPKLETRFKLMFD